MRGVVVVVAALLLGAAAARHRDAATAAGAVRGYRAPGAPHHYAYLGVPYARPPAAHRRFEAPEPVASWSGLFEATHRVRCRQPGGGGDNCLVVNVFTPARARALPVLVHVHGGGFLKGWGFHDAPSRLIRQAIVVVSFNYRLGAFGFLCLGTRSIPGNVGLKDQVAALQWVKRNIASFGGDPSEVTVYGTGSGAACVELLVLAGAAGNLFKRAILENGSALSPSTMSRDPLTAAYDSARALGYGCDRIRKELEKFYSNLSPGQLSNLSRIFVPCVERVSSRSLLHEDPWEVVKEGKFHHVSMMMVYGMAEETALIVEEEGVYKPPEDFSDLIPHNIEVDSTDHRDVITKFIKEFYFEENTMNSNSVESYVDYVNDIFLRYPLVKSAVHHAFGSNLTIYLMNFSFKSRGPNLSTNKKKGTQYQSVLHFLSKDTLDEDESVAVALTTLWSNFIKLGDPTPLTTSETPVIWQPVLPLTLNGAPLLRDTRCLKFSGNMINTKLNCPQLLFWDRVYNHFYTINHE
ncbi:esterase FE4-like [Aricia agestis]|uniref:esterase FE4-like n=1 Tax=Aricia agestis TaxID=91739 RepID=UPI001C20BEDD|nr:esterase FE4-like [Aricia agestis]